MAAHLVNALNFSVNYREDFVELNAAAHRDEVGGLCLFVLSLVVRRLMRAMIFTENVYLAASFECS